MNEIIVQIGAYILVWVLSIVFFNFLSNGFLVKWIRVKASRGRFVLIELDGVAEMTWPLGSLKDNQLRWKSGGEHKTLIVGRDDFYRRYGVKCITIDAETNAVKKMDWTTADKIDAEAYDDLLTRAIQQPEITNKNEKILLIIAIIIALAGIVYIGYTVTTIKQILLNGGGQAIVGVVN